jgi:hypothetical protein
LLQPRQHLAFASIPIGSDVGADSGEAEGDGGEKKECELHVSYLDTNLIITLQSVFKTLSGANSPEFETRVRPLRIGSGKTDCSAVLRKFSGEAIEKKDKGNVAAGVLDVPKRNALQ